MIADGASVLALAARLGVAPQEAAWLYEHDFGAWRYYLVTPLTRAVGRWDLYGAFAEALPLTEVGTRMNVIDVHLVDPSEEMAGLLTSCRGAAAAGQLVEGYAHDGTTFDAYFYGVEAPGDTDPKSLKKAFRRAVRDFLKAAAA